MVRNDGRKEYELRPIRMQTGFAGNADGSVLIEWGRTRVLCTAMLEERVPPFRAGTGQGWLTAEYAMLPASTPVRKSRERAVPDGRSTEIRRLVGRALRAVMDFDALGERTVWIDCDVIEADGGTRTASVTGAYVALCLAARSWQEKGIVTANPVAGAVGAVSVGIVDDTPVLDLHYEEDSRAQVDMNVVMTGDDRFVEVQGTGEQRPYTPDELTCLLALARDGIARIIAMERAALAGDPQ
ncbi:MAG: ribonuclease PH [Clostridiales bacterium]|nr:ribonuclease PH [Clostridiales bacterium]